MRKKIFLFLSIAFLLHGCAVTSLSRTESVEVSQTENLNLLMSMAMAIEIGCNGNGAKTYSAMLSPLIPLPPIIPLFLTGPTNLFITYPPNIQDVSAVLTDSHGILQPITFIEKREEHVGDGYVLFYSVQGNCDSLDGSFLKVEFIDSKTGDTYSYSLELEYKAGDLEFEWGYLSA